MPGYHTDKDGEGRPNWLDDYIEFAADPLDKRTLGDFAQAVGVSDATLWRVRQKYRNEIAKEVEARRKQFLSEMRTKAYKSLYMKLQNDTNALKLFFQLSGDLVERSEVTDKSMMSREEKERKLTELLDSLAKKYEKPDSGQKPSTPEPK